MGRATLPAGRRCGGSVGRAMSTQDAPRRSWPRRTAWSERTHRCGSCARPGAACPSTGRSAATGRSSTRSPAPTSPPRSRCSRSAATASTRPCCSATSSCRPTPSASGSTSRRAPGRSPSSRCATATICAGCDRSSPTTSPTSPRRCALVAAELDRDVPVLAFAGAPFTVASYLIEGRPSRTYEHTKALARTDEALWHDVMDRLATMAVTFIDVQLSAGAQAFQLFDSWAGALSAADYERLVLPHSRRVFAELAARHPDAPGIHFGIGCDHLLESMWAAGPRVIGLDWRTSIRAARGRLGVDVAVQGNLDPALVLAGADVALAATRDVLADNGGHPAHVFNLGHGVHPASDPGVLAAIVDLVHEATRHDDRCRADGIRHATCAIGDRGLLHRHPPWPSAERRAARRPHPPVRGDRRPVAARRDHRGPARRTASSARRAPAGRLRRRRRPQARRAEDRGGCGGAGSRWGRAHRRAGAGAALLGAVGRRVPRSRRGRSS